MGPRAQGLSTSDMIHYCSGKPLAKNIPPSPMSFSSVRLKVLGTKEDIKCLITYNLIASY